MALLRKLPSNCRLIRHWPRGFTALAWFGLAYVTAIDISIIDPSFLESWIWTIGAATVGSLMLMHYVAGGPHLRKAVTFATLVYAVARGLSYVKFGIWAPLMIWMIIVGLTVSVYRNALRRGDND